MKALFRIRNPLMGSLISLSSELGPHGERPRSKMCLTYAGPIRLLMGGNEAPTIPQGSGAGSVLESDEAPRLKKLFVVFGLSSISFWAVVWIIGNAPGLVPQPLLKFIGNLSVILWINTAFYLKNIWENIDTESSEFQREQVKLSLFVVGILILFELPLMLSFL